MPSGAARGVTFALASAVLWGGTVPFAKRVLDTGVDPMEAAGVLYLGAALGLTVLLALRGLVRRDEPATPATSRRDLEYLALAALIGGCVAPVLAMIGQSRTSGMAAALLLNLELPATAAIAVIVYKEALTRGLVLGGGLVLTGAVFVALRAADATSSATGPAATTALGALAMAGSCVCWGIDNNVTTRVAHLDSLRVARWKGAAAAPVTLLAAWAIAGRPLWRGAWTAASLAEMLAVGLVGYGLGLACMVTALRELGAARTGALFATAPFVGALMTMPILGERPTTVIAAAGAVMAAGVSLLIRDRKPA